MQTEKKNRSSARNSRVATEMETEKKNRSSAENSRLAQRTRVLIWRLIATLPADNATTNSARKAGVRGCPWRTPWQTFARVRSWLLAGQSVMESEYIMAGFHTCSLSFLLLVFLFCFELNWIELKGVWHKWKWTSIAGRENNKCKFPTQVQPRLGHYQWFPIFVSEYKLFTYVNKGLVHVACKKI